MAHQQSPSPSDDSHQDLQVRILEEISDKQSEYGFLQRHHVGKILSRNIISQLISTYSLGLRVEDILPGSSKNSYLIVFAILLLLRHGGEISHFVKDGIHDGKLPLQFEPRTFNPWFKESPGQKLQCFREWLRPDKVNFLRYQLLLNVPYLEPGPDFTALHFKWDSVQLPWKLDENEKLDPIRATMNPTRGSGGYSSIYYREIPADCHGFDELLRRVGLRAQAFALKKLRFQPLGNYPEVGRDKYKEMYWNEVQQLRNFSGMRHKHLVTLLLSYEIGDDHYFLLPWAQGCLPDYWDHEPSPDSHSKSTVKWFVKQLSGIMEAVDLIHNPKHLTGQFGRHGDLKPENVLWFDSEDRRGTLVIADMGFTAVHSELSRSAVTGRRIAQTPTYHPPECDVEGAKISRAYDIWTLGCLFLEMTIWFLSGKGGVELFKRDRKTFPDLEGVKTPMFFDIFEAENPERDSEGHVLTHGVRVKPEVTSWLDQIRTVPNSSRLVHDIADIIEDEMIVVLAKGQNRSRSAPLKRRFQSIVKSCDKHGPSYYGRPVSTYKPRIRDSKPIMIAVRLTDNAYEDQKRNRATELSKGIVNHHAALTPRELMRVGVQ